MHLVTRDANLAIVKIGRSAKKNRGGTGRQTQFIIGEESGGKRRLKISQQVHYCQP